MGLNNTEQHIFSSLDNVQGLYLIKSATVNTKIILKKFKMHIFCCRLLQRETRERAYHLVRNSNYGTLFFISIPLTPYSYGVEVFHFSFDLYINDQTPWTSGRPVARPLCIYRITQTQNEPTHTHSTPMP
jgi:hypothetical protein